MEEASSAANASDQATPVHLRSVGHNMAANSEPQAAAEKLPTNPDWMSKLPPTVLSKPLTTIAIPGSHDSFTSDLDITGPLGPDCTKIIRELCKIFGSTARHIIYRWSVTQSLTLTEQLHAGIRYFDLRVSSKPGCQDLYFLHGLYGNKIEDSLVEINQFLNQHPKEVVLLDFNHFYIVPKEAHTTLISKIRQIFDKKLCVYCDVTKVTLQNLWDCNQRVLVFYHSKMADSHPELWPGDSIPSPWGNTVSQPGLLQFLEKNFARGRQSNRFYVSQGVLTPDTKYVIEHLRSSLKSQLAAKVAPHFVEWMTGKSCGHSGINICILDFIEMAGYIDAVIKLNYKE